MSQSCCARSTDCSDCCSSCHIMCLKTLSHCLKKGGDHAKGEHIQLLLDCIAICQSCADLSARGSSACAKMCALCSETCARCAKSCAALAGGDDQMKVCADACRSCSEQCSRNCC